MWTYNRGTIAANATLITVSFVEPSVHEVQTHYEGAKKYVE